MTKELFSKGDSPVECSKSITGMRFFYPVLFYFAVKGAPGNIKLLSRLLQVPVRLIKDLPYQGGFRLRERAGCKGEGKRP